MAILYHVIAQLPKAHCKDQHPDLNMLYIIVIIMIIIRLDAWLEKLKITIRMGLLQKTALLGTAKILIRKVLES